MNREYQAIQADPPPFIIAHPSEVNILEWHYIITGPPNTPYHNGQFWGTLLFPPNYPFAPPAIRMHTPSGRFQPSTRLCLSISDFHPRSFNPAWEVSTILKGLLSFMTSDEMTTGSLRTTDAEKKWHAARSRWWNTTGGGSAKNPVKGNNVTLKGVGAVKAGDGGVKFRVEWPELDAENWTWIEKNNLDPASGQVRITAEGSQTPCSPEVAALRRGPHGTTGLGDAGRAARGMGQHWYWRNKVLVTLVVIIAWVSFRRLSSGTLDP